MKSIGCIDSKVKVFEDLGNQTSKDKTCVRDNGENNEPKFDENLLIPPIEGAKQSNIFRKSILSMNKSCNSFTKDVQMIISSSKYQHLEDAATLSEDNSHELERIQNISDDIERFQEFKIYIESIESTDDQHDSLQNVEIPNESMIVEETTNTENCENELQQKVKESLNIPIIYSEKAKDTSESDDESSDFCMVDENLDENLQFGPRSTRSFERSFKSIPRKKQFCINNSFKYYGKSPNKDVSTDNLTDHMETDLSENVITTPETNYKFQMTNQNYKPSCERLDDVFVYSVPTQIENHTKKETQTSKQNLIQESNNETKTRNISHPCAEETNHGSSKSVMSPSQGLTTSVSPSAISSSQSSPTVMPMKTSTSLNLLPTTIGCNETDSHKNKGMIAGMLAGVNAGVNASLHVGSEVVAGVNAGVNVGVDAVVATLGKRTDSVKRKHGRPHKYTSFTVPEKINETKETNQDEECNIKFIDTQESNKSIDMNVKVVGRSEFFDQNQDEFDNNIPENIIENEVKVKKPISGKGGFFNSFSYHPYSNSDKSKDGKISKKERLRRSSCELDESFLKELQKKNIKKELNTAETKNKQPPSPDQKLIENLSGAIPKTPANIGKDIYKKNDTAKGKPPKHKKKDEIPRPSSAGSIESSRREDSSKQKKTLTATNSVPFWVKLSDEINLDNALSKMSKASSSSGNSGSFGRKMGHKRTRSYDLGHIVSDTSPLVILKRSTSFEHLENLRDNGTAEKSSISETLEEKPPNLQEMKDLSVSEFSVLGPTSKVGHSKSPAANKTLADSLSVSMDNIISDKKCKRTKGEESVLINGDHQSKKAHGDACPPVERKYLPPVCKKPAHEKGNIKRLIGMFQAPSTMDVKMDLLVQQLDLYSRQGIPQLPSGFNTTHLDPLLESSWQELVDDPDQLDDRQQQQQLAIWELVTTEATHIHMLKVITDLFLACIRSLQNETLLNEIDTEKLFSNIQEIYAANVTFWQEHIIKMVEHSRNTRQPLDPSMLSEGFYKFDEILQPYTRYCMEQSNCHLYCKEKDFENEYFKTYLAWCETQKECNRLRLADILVRPMQRLTKYTLLLKAIAKKTTLEDHKILLGEMVSHVDSYVSNVNSALRNRHEQQKLRDIENRIDSYDVVESRDDDLERVVKKYSDLNLTQPMPGCPEHLARNILHHGDLKLRDHTIGKMEVHVFLFTDILLITKVTQKKGERVKIIRPPYHVARLIIVDVKDVSALGLVYINEWNVAVAAFTLQCHDPRAHRVWVEQIRKAQEQYRDAKQRKDNLVLEELYGTHLIDRTPRIGSSRASRGSSLAHSHSGSMELDPASPISTLRGGHQVHQQSTEQSDMRGSNIDFRASSASSEDSGSHSAEVQRSRSLESGSNVPSTRPDYRPSQAKTANTLTVRTPYSTGQSLPNLDVEASQSLRVPPTSSSSSSHKLLSNSARGISYPPHSPRTLRRLAPVPQSRNPPLVKSRNISGIPQLQEEAIDQENIPRERTRRMMRNDRNDNRRYHTAGVVDDIKKQDTKDTAIHKRLSLNYGKGAPVSNKPLQLSCTLDSDHRLRMKHRSCESIQSSSGVSSTSSLHSRSMGSELETLELIDDTEFEGDISGTIVDLEVTDCTNLKLSPHISSTYISAHTDVTLGSGCHQYVMHTNQTTQQNADSNESTGTLKIDVSESSPGISSVQITVSDRVTTSATEAYVNDSEHWNSTEPNFRDILLNDANIESSDV